MRPREGAPEQEKPRRLHRYEIGIGNPVGLSQIEYQANSRNARSPFQPAAPGDFRATHHPLQTGAGECSSARAFAAYAWNIALCESLYPALNGLEIVLRNSIHDAATAEFRNDQWFNQLRLSKSRDAIHRAHQELNRIRSQGGLITAGELVAQLNFGFWIGLFDSRYEQQLWPSLLRPVFPHMPRRLRQRSELARRLHRIRLIRNRVFHHEPLWNRQDLADQHTQIIEMIGWINPDMSRFVHMLDRFPEVHSRDLHTYSNEIESIFQVPTIS